MYIVSQNEAVIVDCSKVKCFLCDKEHFVYADGIELGQYTSDEQAKNAIAGIKGALAKSADLSVYFYSMPQR